MAIYVVEIPHQMPPVAWTARSESELIRRVKEADLPGIVYERTTVRELVDTYGDDDEQVAELARLHGPETVLYVADYLIGEGEYTTEAVSEYDAAVAAIGHDLHSVMIFSSEAEARAALDADENWETLHQGLQAREALRDLLGE